jgi:DNA-damage-inducible protein D
VSNIRLFESKRIRSEWNEDERKWYFSVSDAISVLSDSADPKAYWRQLKRREPELVTFCHGLKLLSTDGKMRVEDCANAEGLLRIIQSVPSPKAEPFKRWLARVGYERLEEIENPELASVRVRAIYKSKGYSDDWIDKRMRGIAVRDELTGEWKQRGVKEGIEYAILTAEISKATFGLTPSEYRDHKGLAKGGDNLRDHMTDLELIFTMLGEASTTEIARTGDAQGLNENAVAARAGGNVAGNARQELEKKSGRRVVSRQNFKVLPESSGRQLPEPE